MDDDVERRWIELGLVDPSYPLAGQRRELLAWLTDRGLDDQALVDACQRRPLWSLC